MAPIAGTSTPDAWQGLIGQGVVNSMYDHAEDDIEQFMSVQDQQLTNVLNSDV
jgi:hypothetical protein